MAEWLDNCPRAKFAALLCSGLLCRRGIDVLKGIVAMLINICLHTFGGWTGSLCQLCNKLRHTNSGRTQATQRRSRRRERRRHLPVHMQPLGPRRDALTPSGMRCGLGGGGPRPHPPPPRPSTWSVLSVARPPQPPSATDSLPELRTLRALAHPVPVRACGAHVKLTVIDSMMDDRHVG